MDELSRLSDVLMVGATVVAGGVLIKFALDLMNSVRRGGGGLVREVIVRARPGMVGVGERVDVSVQVNLYRRVSENIRVPVTLYLVNTERDKLIEFDVEIKAGTDAGAYGTAIMFNKPGTYRIVAEAGGVESEPALVMVVPAQPVGRR